MKRILVAILALLGAPAATFAQSVKDLVEIEGARANKLRGYGVVTGLNGTGDTPRGEPARLLNNMLQNLVTPEGAVEKIEARSVALVLVTAELPPFQKQGTRMDVSVSTLGDCKSLYGGELQLTDLRGPQGRQDPNVYALASGRLILQGDARKGSATSATVPGGAIVEKELLHTFIQEVPGGSPLGPGRHKAFTLLLKKPDLSLAGQLTYQINATALTGEGRPRDVAMALDGGSVRVFIPTAKEYQEVTGSAPPVDFEREPVRWLEVILSRPATFPASEAAAVIVNDVTKAVSWTGDVRLRRGTVMLPAAAPGARPSVFHAEESQRLSEFMEKTAPALTEQQLVDLIKALHGAGLIKGEVRSQ